jgi:hypothetical protein
MIVCKELDKSFDTKSKLFEALRTNKSHIIEMKKAQVLKSCEKETTIKARLLKPELLSGASKELLLDSDYHHIAVNSTKILDSHEDLHLDGLWSKSVKEQQGKNYLVLDHQLSVFNTVVKKEDIEMFTAVVTFAAIGKAYEGDTEVLVYKFLKSKVLIPSISEWLESGDDIEASVRMQYVKLDLAMDSEEEADKEAKRIFDKYYPIIANKEDFEEIRYFWVISEAKNVRESSLVLAGSNGATGALESKNIEPPEGTQESEAEKSLQQDQNNYYKSLF